jgi:hypothetical protein
VRAEPSGTSRPISRTDGAGNIGQQTKVLALYRQSMIPSDLMPIAVLGRFLRGLTHCQEPPCTLSPKRSSSSHLPQFGEKATQNHQQVAFHASRGRTTKRTASRQSVNQYQSSTTSKLDNHIGPRKKRLCFTTWRVSWLQNLLLK